MKVVFLHRYIVLIVLNAVFTLLDRLNIGKN